MVLVVSCKDESVEKSNSIEKSKDFSASKRLAAIEEKINPSDEDINEYLKEFKSLSFDELIALRKLQHEKIKSKMGNKSEIAESLEKDIRKSLKLTKLSDLLDKVD